MGIQTFSKIREGGYVYVDKTEYVYNMTRSSYVFLSRPRRFGKSLLTSTLESYFEGRKDLFKGLAIEKLEKDWIEYPVIRLDMSGGKHLDKNALIRYILDVLADNAKRLGVEINAIDTNIAFNQLIVNAAEKHGKKVVVLIDEYDAPLLDVMHEDQNLKDLRAVMQNLYSPIKKNDRYLQFVFITGITKFSQLSIFSELNNLMNISMDKEYAGVCGITEEEMLTQLDTGLEALAAELEMTKGKAVEALKKNYDGYHFTWPSPDVYNPFSLLNALFKKKIGSYWFASGTPTYLIEMLRKFHVTPSELCSPNQAFESDFDAPTERMTTITPLLYQSGYITIKGYDDSVELYTLDIPNREIRIGLLKSLLPNYLGMRSVKGSTTIGLMQKALMQGDIDQMFQRLQDFLGTIPYVNDISAAEDKEGHWQQMLYVILSMLGANCDVEVHTPKGRVDLVAQTADKLYLIELKLGQSSDAAIRQIDLKDYAKRFALSGLPIVKVGVNFDPEKRNITDWEAKDA